MQTGPPKERVLQRAENHRTGFERTQVQADWVDPQTLPLIQQHLLLGKKIINTTNLPEAGRPQGRPQGCASASWTEDPGARLRLEMAPPLLSPHCSPADITNRLQSPLPREPGAPALPTTVPINPTAKGVALEADLHACRRQQTHVRKQTWFSAKRLFSQSGAQCPAFPVLIRRKLRYPGNTWRDFTLTRQARTLPASFSFPGT